METLLALVLLLNMQTITGNIIPENPAFAFPDEIEGWRVEDIGYWDKHTLFDYINGGAELFLSFDFENAASRYYVRENQPGISVDIFRMASPADAFGVFSLSREKEHADFGQAAQVGSGLIMFWKHRYSVSIASYPETEESRAAIRRLARMIDEAIPDTGVMPSMLSMLPSADIRRESVRYFRHHAWQNVYGFISHDDILRIDGSAEVVCARFGEGKHAATLFLVRYPDAETATEGLAFWREHYGIANSDNITIIEERWYAAEQRDEYLILLHDAPDSSVAQARIEQTLHMFE